LHLREPKRKNRIVVYLFSFERERLNDFSTFPLTHPKKNLQINSLEGQAPFFNAKEIEKMYYIEAMRLLKKD